MNQQNCTVMQMIPKLLLGNENVMANWREWKILNVVVRLKNIRPVHYTKNRWQQDITIYIL